jgi:hypothetical protein
MCRTAILALIEQSAAWLEEKEPQALALLDTAYKLLSEHLVQTPKTFHACLPECVCLPGGMQANRYIVLFQYNARYCPVGAR